MIHDYYYAPQQVLFGISHSRAYPRDETPSISNDSSIICSSVNDNWHILQDHLGKRHIGLVIEAIDSNGNVIACVDVLMTPQSFFTFPMQTAKSYLIELADEDDDEVVLAADFEHAIRFQGLYDLPDSPLIIKTHWISFIQRKWKRIYKERMRKLMERGSLKSQRTFELCGKYS